MAILDIGIRRPTVGNRVFAVMKGACDGGIHIPHSTRKFPGFEKSKNKADSKYDASVHKKRIYGGHIDDYMNYLKKEDQEAYTKQFGLWINNISKAGVKSVEELFGKIFDGIRKNSDHVKVNKVKKAVTYEDAKKTVIVTSKGKYTRARKLTKLERSENVQRKKEIVKKQLASK